MAKTWTDAELDALAADIVDHTIIAAGGDVQLAAKVLNHTPALEPRLALCCLYG